MGDLWIQTDRFKKEEVILLSLNDLIQGVLVWTVRHELAQLLQHLYLRRGIGEVGVGQFAERWGVRGLLPLQRVQSQGEIIDSVDAREPQNPTNSDENTRGILKDSQEHAPCATYWFLGLIQVRNEEGYRGWARADAQRWRSLFITPHNNTRQHSAGHVTKNHPEEKTKKATVARSTIASSQDPWRVLTTYAAE
eukprot:6063814-Pyramimonas_sp.AAC.1